MTETLGNFIEQQLAMRQMSAREFAQFVGVSPSLINKFRNHGINDTFAGQPVGNPGLEFIYKLHKATHVGIASLCKLVFPDIDAPPPSVWVIADYVTRLPDDKREMAETFLEGLVAKSLQKRKE